MIERLGGNAAYVTGAVRSAVYCFDTGRVYSLNNHATDILTKYFLDTSRNLSQDDKDFILQAEKLTGANFSEHEEYIFPELRPEIKFAWLELTHRCNFRCVHCYQGDLHNETGGPLSFHEWQGVISQLAELHCNNIQFIGGEPCLYGGLADLIRFSHDAGIENISLSTNLSHIDGELLSSFADCGVQVNFSVYGASSNIHDRITRIPGSFELLTRNIKRLNDSGISMRANVIIMRGNESFRDDIKAMLESLGVSHVKFDEIRGGDESLAPENPRMQAHSPNFRTSRKSFELNHSANSCWFGKFAVSPDGTIYPCEFERRIKYGNIRRERVADILAGNEIRRWWYFSHNNIHPCSSCEYRLACRDCRPICGNMTGKNPRCFYDPLSGEWR
ncbi:MAG: radical SAM protein [Synergistaceae bacterium]|nr:radical SAM protein [Synergistaceae bacterium]